MHHRLSERRVNEGNMFYDSNIPVLFFALLVLLKILFLNTLSNPSNNNEKHMKKERKS